MVTRNAADEATGASGTVLQGQGVGTASAFSTATYPASTTINNILYSSSSNVVGQITTANNGVLITSAGGVPSLLAGGTTGQILTATTGAPASWASPATSGTVTSVSGTANQVAVANGTTTPVISLIGPYTPATYTAHGVLVGEGTSSITALAAGSSGQVLQSGGASADPAYSTATYPATTTSQQILYSTAANVVGQLTTANSSLAATNSSGTLAMRAFSTVIQVFTTTGTYTPTAGMLYSIIECCGGGGGGGGPFSTTAGQFSCSGAGAAGERAVGVFSAATVGASQSVTIGAAGGGGTTGVTGTAGGTTSVGALITAGGGGGGTAAAAAAAGSVSQGGAGGTGGSGGSYRGQGQPGTLGFTLALTTGYGGTGGCSLYGSGGQGTAINTTGAAASGNGAGGGGVVSTASQAGFTGGAGTKGIVVVTEYVIA